MRRVLFVALLLCVTGAIFYSCAKYKDPKGYTDPRLTNPYCNDPNAVNYNVGFPGKPDSTVCIYPSNLFVGTFVFHDSVANDSLFLYMDSLVLRIYDSSNSHFKIGVAGFCPADTARQIFFTASTIRIATVDTSVNDTLTLTAGQQMCRPVDTVTGTIQLDAIDSTLLHITLTVMTDTGLAKHTGSARKQ